MLRLADEVAQPVGEVFSVSGGGDVVPCGLVQVAQGHAGPQHGLRQLVGLPHQVVDGGVLGIRRPAEEGPGHVGAVAVLPAAHVDDDAVPSLQAGLVRLVVGVRGVGAVGDDGQERSGVTALGGILCHDVVGHLPLGHALFHVGGSPLHHHVVDAGGLPHQVPLHRVLAGPGVVHAVGGQHILAAGIVGHQGQQKPGGPVLVHAHVFFPVHGICQNGEIVVRVGEPHLLIGCLRHREQFVQK